MPVLLVFFVLAATASLSGQGTPWRFAHPNAKALAAIDWQALQKGPGADLFRSVGLDGIADGTEFVERMDRLLFSSPGPRTPGDREAPFLIYAEGRFNLAELRRRARQDGARTTAYRLVEVYVPPEGDVHVAVLSPMALLIGDRASLYAAIERKDGDRAPAGPVFDRALVLSRSSDAWAVFSVPPTSVAPDKLAAIPFAAGIETMELAMSVRDGAGFRMRMTAADERAARMLKANLEAAIALAAMRGDGGAQIKGLLQLCRVTASGRSVNLALDARPAQLLVAAKPVRPERPAPAEIALSQPAGRKVIRIYGLDEGTREIPFER